MIALDARPTVAELAATGHLLANEVRNSTDLKRRAYLFDAIEDFLDELFAQLPRRTLAQPAPVRQG